MTQAFLQNYQGWRGRQLEPLRDGDGVTEKETLTRNDTNSSRWTTSPFPQTLHLVGMGLLSPSKNKEKTTL